LTCSIRRFSFMKSTYLRNRLNPQAGVTYILHNHLPGEKKTQANLRSHRFHTTRDKCSTKRKQTRRKNESQHAHTHNRCNKKKQEMTSPMPLSKLHREAQSPHNDLTLPWPLNSFAFLKNLSLVETENETKKESKP
jgi:hypothetical protein